MVTTDWARVAVALANGQVDCAWMGPWGYVLAKDRSGAEALATVEYNGKPTYNPIIIARLDPANADAILGLLRNLARHGGLAVLVCLRQLELARRFADRCLALSEAGLTLPSAAVPSAAPRRSGYGPPHPSA